MHQTSVISDKTVGREKLAIYTIRDHAILKKNVYSSSTKKTCGPHDERRLTHHWQGTDRENPQACMRKSTSNGNSWNINSAELETWHQQFRLPKCAYKRTRDTEVMWISKQVCIDSEYQLVKYGFYTIETRCSENIKTIEFAHINSSHMIQTICRTHQ